MAVVARMLGRHLGADRCAYAEVEDESVFVITGNYTDGVPSIVGRWPVAAFGPELVRLMAANEPYVMDDVETDPRAGADLSAYRATTIRAVICVPLHKGGKFTAAMAVHQKVPRRWTPEEIRLVRIVVGRCWESLERARVARDLRESEERQRTLADNLPSGFIYQIVHAIDGTSRFTYVSGGVEALCGVTPGEVVANPAMLHGLIVEEDRALLRAAEEDAIRDRRPFDCQFRVRARDGQVRWLHCRSAPRELPGGSVVWDGIAVEITERVEMEQALLEADRKKDEFIALLGHELRNPLAPIRNGLQVMRLAGGDANVVAQARDMMDRQLGHMVRLIDDLLDVSRVSRNKMQLRKARVTLADVVGSAVETARPLIEAARHELVVTLPPEPVVLDADLTRLAQVLSNLLTNSAKYTEAGGKIWLTAELASRERERPEVILSVRDTGIGIPAEALPTIFDMFSQVDRTLERTTGGLGIGLALVRGLVEMHGGTVAAASDGPGRGSTFTVRLPVVPAADPGPRPEAPAANGRPAGGGPRRVLVVDDNRDAAASMAQMLRLLGHEVSTAHDGAEAVEAAEGFRPDVVLMDVGMPRLNGHEATRRIRERPWGRGVRVVALTGWGQDVDRVRSKEAGCDGHLVKPVSLSDLERALAALPNGSAS
jgi:PAS domain S-box-containing protein